MILAFDSVSVLALQFEEHSASLRHAIVIFSLESIIAKQLNLAHSRFYLVSVNEQAEGDFAQNNFSTFPREGVIDSILPLHRFV